MLGTVIVGAVFAGILLWALSKTRKTLKDNQCSCGSSCSDKSRCHIVK